MKWDGWYLEQFMMQLDEDPELVYEVGIEELIYRHHEKESYKKMISAPPRPNGIKYFCKSCKVRFI